jgi:hypothetical protein
MKVWPFTAALRWEAANHHMLRGLKTVVVSDAEKAHEMRQVGIGKTVRSRSLARQRLTHMRDFYAVLLDEIPALLDRWHQQPGRPS